MARPTLSGNFAVRRPIQSSTGICFECVHDFLGHGSGFHHDVNVIGSHMCRKQSPPAVCAYVVQSAEDGCSALCIEEEGRLVHFLSLDLGAHLIGIDEGGSR
jgi:hypothetical protein